MQAFYPEVFRGLLEGIEWLLHPPKGWGQLHQAKVKAVPHMKVSPFFCGGLAEPEFGG
jgi:hypothetical protein